MQSYITSHHRRPSSIPRQRPLLAGHWYLNAGAASSSPPAPASGRGGGTAHHAASWLFEKGCVVPFAQTRTVPPSSYDLLNSRSPKASPDFCFLCLSSALPTLRRISLKQLSRRLSLAHEFHTSLCNINSIILGSLLHNLSDLSFFSAYQTRSFLPEAQGL